MLLEFSHFFAQIFPGHALLFILKLWARDFEPGHGMAANCQRIVFGAEFSMASKRWRRRRHPGGELWRSSNAHTLLNFGTFGIHGKLGFSTLEFGPFLGM